MPLNFRLNPMRDCIRDTDGKKCARFDGEQIIGTLKEQGKTHGTSGATGHQFDRPKTFSSFSQVRSMAYADDIYGMPICP